MSSPDPTEPRPGPSRPRLTRSTGDRLIGGVAGGLARHLGIDPILVRVAFVLLSFVGGAGVLAYLALLAFVPSDGGTPPPGNRTGTVVGTVALAVAAVVFLGPPVVFLGPGLLVVALVAVAVVLVVRAAGGTEDPGRAAARIGIGILVGLAAIGAAIGVGLAAALGGGMVIAILTVVAGLALVATAFVGGARWLILPALVLAVPLAVVAAADLDVGGGIGDRSYHPRDVSELRPGYELGVGQLDLDLRDVSLPPGTTNVTIDVGIGEARVRVPEDACVTTHADIGIGAATVFERDNAGVDVAYAESADPGSTTPRLHVDADIGAGQLDIARDGFGDHAFLRSGSLGDRGVSCP